MLWGHREVARVLAHEMWFQRKSKEQFAKKSVDKFMQSLSEDFQRSEEKLKIEKHLKSEQCYKDWYSKNKFVYNPLLFGPVSKEERAKLENQLIINSSLISAPFISPHMKSYDGEEIHKKKKQETKSIKKSQHSRRSDRHVDFIPLNDFYK